MDVTAASYVYFYMPKYYKTSKRNNNTKFINYISYIITFKQTINYECWYKFDPLARYNN